jgi:hypothetical protein
MSEKSTIFQGVQIGIETVPGTPVAANKKLLACSLTPSVQSESDVFKAMGNKYASFATVNKEWSQAAISGRLTYNEILYLLVSLLSQPTPAQQGATTAYKWTFTSNTSAEDAGKTLTVEQGDVNSAWRGAGVKVAGLEMTFNRSAVEISGTALGQALDTGITLTASPTSLPALPVMATQLKFYLADTQAGLAGATALTRGFSLVWRLNDKNALAWPVGQSPVVLESDPTLEATLQLATDTVGLGLLATMRSGATKWLRVKAEGATIESTYKHTVQIDFAGQISAVSEFSDQEGIYAMEYTLTGVHDAAWGKAFEVQVITNVQTL